MVLVIVVMPSVPGHTPVGDPDLKQTLQPKSNHGIPRNPYRSTPGLTAVNRSDDGAHDTVVAPRFDAIRIRFDCVALPIQHDRFQIKNQVIIRSYSDDQLGG